MRFANPQAFYLLWLLPLIAGALHLFYHHRFSMMKRFVEGHLIDELAEGFSLKFYRLKAVLILVAFALMVAALARPQWGYHIQPVKRHGLDIMVVVDVSKSMLTQDVLPSRLERSKLAIRDLMMKLGGSDHIGLIAFAGDAMIMCPFTYDYNGFLLSLDDLGPDSIPRGGTDIGAAIDEATKAYQNMPDSDKAVVLITDGEEEEGDAISAAQRARAKGIHIFTVGVGTKAGDLIQITNADGQTEFLKDAQGNVVKSHLNENLLEQIAYITGGAYVRSSATEFGLDYLYDRQLSKLKKHDEETKTTRLYDEHYQWPLALALIILFVEAFFPLFLLKSGLPLVFIVFFLMSNQAFASVAGDVNKANDLYKLGKFDDSFDLYKQALDEDAQSPLVKYDLGTDLYKKGDYKQALQYLEQAAQDKTLKIKPAAEYNIGNALYRSAQQKEKSNVDEAIKSLQEALGHYGETINADPKDQDAIYNEDVVKKEIERLKQQKQQQQQQQQNQQNQNQKNQKQQQQQGGQSQQQQQQNQAQAQQQKQNQQQQAKQQQGQQQKQQSSSGQQQHPMSQQELDRKQAQDMLEDYQENEEPKKLLNYMPKKIDDRPVLKDW